ncbi:uncharacterized protein LOC133742880 isoform X4 [Rosa rugosa]|uniref:uncharacterized protein LOC133742880 isoform X4 n=1 Tax=Rosa rugosa TaxID=74645 RepID=UPI002B41037F|nr:uncharacterized protein LOC133742880 isoform X4 [Rosa rugosa]
MKEYGFRYGIKDIAAYRDGKEESFSKKSPGRYIVPKMKMLAHYAKEEDDVEVHSAALALHQLLITVDKLFGLQCIAARYSRDPKTPS